MLPDEAIEQNKQWLREHPHLAAVGGHAALPPYAAIRLGVEALERLKQIREIPFIEWVRSMTEVVKLLPSETAEKKKGR